MVALSALLSFLFGTHSVLETVCEKISCERKKNAILIQRYRTQTTQNAYRTNTDDALFVRTHAHCPRKIKSNNNNVNT